MKHLILISAVILLSGCVTTNNVEKYTDAELCYFLDPIRNVTLMGEAKVIRDEMKKRGLNCNEQVIKIQ